MKIIVVFLLCTSLSLFAFETSNIQLLYSDNFDGDAFIYDVKDAKKTTVTFEHFRTFGYGDFFMFIDMVDGKKFDGSEHDVYVELAPRVSLSKISKKSLSFGLIQDWYISTQLNVGDDYRAYMGGIGIDLLLPLFTFVNINLYHKSENINESDSYQMTAAYRTKPLYGLHINGFLDMTKRDINTHNQLLFDISTLLDTNEQIYIGCEWIYYRYDYGQKNFRTNTLQAMLKYKF